MVEEHHAEEQAPGPGPDCWSCGNEVGENARYCRHCGAALEPDLKETIGQKSGRIWLVGVYFALTLALCSIAQYSEWHEIETLLIFDALLIAGTVIFAAAGWKHIRFSLSLRGFSLSRASFYILIAAGFSIMVQYTMTWLNRNLFEQDIYYYQAFSDMPYPLLISILVMAVEPAIIEELGFRGLIQGTLNTVLDKPQSLSITAFAFAIIHLSLISIIWLMPFALLLGYIRMREGNLWYGVLMHFVFNTIAVLHDLPEYYGNY